MRKQVLSLLLVLTAITATAQTVGDAIYFYRNDGSFNAFFRSDIDSITFSTLVVDSLDADGMMVQSIHTADSIYRIPLATIDSVSFVNPETIFQPDVVKMDDSMLSYLLAADGLVLTFNGTMPARLRPRQGDVLLSTVRDHFLLSNGFAGKVTSVSEQAGNILVVCAIVDDVSDIFVQLIGIERIDVDSEQSRSRGKDSGEIDERSVSLNLELSEELTDGVEVSLNGTMNGRISGNYVYFFNLFNQVLDVKLRHEWDYSVKTGFKVEKSFEWPNETSAYKEKTLAKVLFPAVAPVFKIELSGTPFLKVEGTAEAAFNYQSRHYSYITHIKYEDSKGFEGSETSPDKGANTETEPSFDSEISIKGSLFAGGKIGFSVGTIDFFGGYLRAKANLAIGPKIEADFNLKGDLNNFYSEHKDSKLRLGLTTDVEIFGEAKFWGIEKAKSTIFKESFASPFSWEWYLLPKFENIKAYGTSGNNSTGSCYGRATRKCPFPIDLGFAAYDVFNNHLGTFYDNTPYTNQSADFTADISGLSSGKVTVFPIIKISDQEILATPSTELIKIATLPSENGDRTITLKGKVYGTNNCYNLSFIYGNTSNLEYYNEVSATTTNNGEFSATISNTTGRTIYYKASGFIINKSGQFELMEGETQIATEMVDNPDVPTSGQLVDLGLSVKWAGWDVGANSPEETGNLYAWGETETKSEYTSENYSHFNNDNIGGNWRTTGLYCNLGDDISGTQYDAAHVKWGDGWRMPAKEEAEELLTQCTKKKITYKGVEGWLLTGPNGNKIFLIPTTTGGNFWTSTWGPQTTHLAWTITNNMQIDRTRCMLYNGRRIRAVHD